MNRVEYLVEKIRREVVVVVVVVAVVVVVVRLAYGILAPPPTPNLFKKKFIFARNSHSKIGNKKRICIQE